MPCPIPLAESWPTPVDRWLLAGYLLVIVGVPVAGYVLLAVDIRAHYRKLRQALVVVSNYTVRIPRWVLGEAEKRQQVPPCLAAFGLALPCSEADLLEAYRREVKTRHPDVGGDRADFLQLQRYFEQARSMLTASD